MGFSLGYEGVALNRSSRNALSANNNPDLVLEKVNSEISLGRIAGPFIRQPFKDFICSPLSLRE